METVRMETFMGFIVVKLMFFNNRNLESRPECVLKDFGIINNLLISVYESNFRLSNWNSYLVTG